jgi:single-strand DNA-binding protein
MARGLNKVLLIGNLGKDPEMKYTPQGTPMTTFSVAVSRRRQTPDGEWKDETEWFRIVAWQKLAEQCNEYLRKGSKVYIEGRLQTREWQGQDGQNRQIVEVIANEMMMLDSRQGGSGGPGERGGYYGDERPAPARGGGSPGGGAPEPGGFEDDVDSDVDDIPF